MLRRAMVGFNINSTMLMKSGYEMPVLGFGVSLKALQERKLD